MSSEGASGLGLRYPSSGLGSLGGRAIWPSVVLSSIENDNNRLDQGSEGARKRRVRQTTVGSLGPVRYHRRSADAGPHRLVAKDTTLSRWRHGFESRWGCLLGLTPLGGSAL